jgi:hypothetical protein
MGHYDSGYEYEYEQRRKAAKAQAEKQLELMNTFHTNLISHVGASGISPRHLDALQDLINETKLRTL